MNRITCLRPDWSNQGIGYFLSQKHCECPSDRPGCCNNGWKITLAGSRFLSSAEKRYAPVEGEALAVAWGLEQTRYFTQGSDKLLIVTDHKPLVKILGDRTLDEISNSRLFRLKQRTLPWRFKIIHMPGKTNDAADATSRHPSPSTSGIDEPIYPYLLSDGDRLEHAMNNAIQYNATTVTAISWNEIATETAADCTLSKLNKLIRNGFPSSRKQIDSNIAPFWNFRHELLLADQNVIIYGDRVVIPSSPPFCA